MKGIYISTI